MNPAAALVSLSSIRTFVLAGNALFTLRSIVSGNRKTFKVVAAKDKQDFYFVSLLNGSDNSSDYKYLGALFVTRQAALGFKLNREGWGVEAGAAFGWLVKEINAQDDKFFEQCEFWHAGQCGKCGRTLTTPESIASGLGPVCAARD